MERTAQESFPAVMSEQNEVTCKHCLSVSKGMLGEVESERDEPKAGPWLQHNSLEGPKSTSAGER